MTGLLTDLMKERADSLEPPVLDVGAMVLEGDRRSVQRHRAFAGGLVAASLVVAAAVAVPAWRGDERRTDPASAVHSYDVAYALGSTIHDGARTVETDVRIAALAQGASGYVVADVRGRVHRVVGGTTTEVGRLQQLERGRIVSDGDVVAWVDAADGGTITVLDLGSGDRVDVPVDDWEGDARIVQPGVMDDEGQARVVAVDGRTVYVADTQGVMAWDAFERDAPVLLPAPNGIPVEVLGVEEGQVLQRATTFESEEEEDGSTTTALGEEVRVGPDLESARALPGTWGILSPGADLVALSERRSKDGSPSYYTATVGEPTGDRWQPVTSAGHDSIEVMRWLDADTFEASGWSLAALDAGEGGRDLLTCEARTGSCTTVLQDMDREIVLATGHVPLWVDPAGLT